MIYSMYSQMIYSQIVSVMSIFRRLGIKWIINTLILGIKQKVSLVNTLLHATDLLLLRYLDTYQLQLTRFYIDVLPVSKYFSFNVKSLKKLYRRLFWATQTRFRQSSRIVPLRTHRKSTNIRKYSHSFLFCFYIFEYICIGWVGIFPCFDKINFVTFMKLFAQLK